MDRKILINVEDADLRVAFLEDGKLVGLQVEPYEEKSIVGNLYKGRVEGIVPGLKAVFVNIGFDKNAFLHFSDVRQEYVLPSHGRPTRRPPGPGPAPEGAALTVSPVAQKPPVKKRVGSRKDGNALEVGDELLVQVSKDEIGDKGPRITTHVSLPGRYLVYLPFAEREGGVSRRIEDAEERRRLRKILDELKTDTGSFIVRTVSLDQNEDALSADVRHLNRQWKAIERKAARTKAPSLIHNDHDILFRLVRDSFSSDESQVIVDDPAPAKKLLLAVRQLMPESKMKIEVHGGPKGLFEVHDVERQIQRALKSKVWLKSGGYVIIEETEAMTAIDVNTGKFTGHGDQEETILRVNLEAAAEIANQLRVRDIGGIIVVDFIDMIPRKNQETLLREVGRLLKLDRAKSTYTDISEFGIIQITRKRVRQSLLRTLMAPCPYCEGAGNILGHAEIWRAIKYAMIRELESKALPEALEVTVHPEIRKFLEESLLDAIRRLANHYKITLSFVAGELDHLEKYHIRRRERKAEEVPVQSSGSNVTKEKSTGRRPSRGSRGRGRRPPASPPEKNLESTLTG